MTSLLRSSSDSRIIDLREELTLSLFLRHGDFWESVRDMRNKWRITPVVNVPASLAHLEHRLRFHPGLDPWEDFGSAQASYPEDDVNIEVTSEWLLDIDSVFRCAVPDQALPDISLNYHRILVEVNWRAFIGACILYDPPPDKLLEFAYCIPIQTVALGSTSSVMPSSDKGSFAMALPPVATVYPRDVETMATGAYYEMLLTVIDEMFLKPNGMDLKEMRSSAIQAHPELLKIRESSLDKFGAQHVIVVDEATTSEDVKHAFRMIADTLDSRPRRGRRERKRIESVQVAVWHDKFKMPLVEIGKRTGWGVGEDDDGRPKSERIRKHLHDGRRLIAEAEGENPAE